MRFGPASPRPSSVGTAREPDGIKGEDVLPSARLVHLADVVEVFHHTGGVEAAVEVARARSGGQFDPTLVELFEDEAGPIFAELDQVTTWEAVMGKAPTVSTELTEDELDRVLAAIADFVDLKSPYTLGHSRGVAELAAAAADEWCAHPDGTPGRAGARPRSDGCRQHHLGQARAADRRRGRTGAAAPVLHRPHPGLSPGPRMPSASRGTAPRAPGRLWVPPREHR